MDVNLWKCLKCNDIAHFFPVAYDYGGVVTNSRREPEYVNKSKRPGNLKEMHWSVS